MQIKDVFLLPQILQKTQILIGEILMMVKKLKFEHSRHKKQQYL